MARAPFKRRLVTVGGLRWTGVGYGIDLLAL
jgi:hypothetical protein